MSETSKEQNSGAETEDDGERRQRIADVQAELDARVDGDGLAAEAGAGEEMGLAEG
jgi:hypothetical protein